MRDLPKLLTNYVHIIHTDTLKQNPTSGNHSMTLFNNDIEMNVPTKYDGKQVTTDHHISHFQPMFKFRRNIIISAHN